MAWTRIDCGTYECIDMMTQPVNTPRKVTENGNNYYIYIFTVSEHKTAKITLTDPGGGYGNPGGIYYIGSGEVPEPIVDQDEETGEYDYTSIPSSGILAQVNTYYHNYSVEFDALPGILYWIWLVPNVTYNRAIIFNINMSNKYAEPFFDIAKVGPDGLSVKVMDRYAMINGTCKIYINDIESGTLTIKSSFNWQEWGTNGLAAGKYTIKVQYLSKDDGTWHSMLYYWGHSSTNPVYEATIEISGAGNIGGAYFTAVPDSNNGNIIRIDVHNLDSITPLDSIDHYVYSISKQSDAFPTNVESTSAAHDFTNLLDGSWLVTVYVILITGASLRVPTQSYSRTSYVEIVTFGGDSGGGGGTATTSWNIVSENLGNIDSSYVNFRYYEQYTLYRFRASFTSSGTVRFYSSASTTGVVADPKGWITKYTTTYNSDLGEPPPSALVAGEYTTDDNSAGYQFVMTFAVEAGIEYCFWFRLTDGTKTGYTYVGIEPPSATGSGWKYNEGYFDITNISSTQTKDVRLQSYEGALFKVTFASAGIAKFLASIPSYIANVYVTTGRYGWDIDDGAPLTESGVKATEISGTSYPVLADTDYYVWVKGSDINVRGTATVTITFTKSWSYTYNSNLNIRNISSTQTRTTSVSRYTGSCFLVTFASAGTAAFSISDNNVYIIYVTNGYYQWDPEDGLPYKDNHQNKASGGASVSMTVNTSDSYYIWVRGQTAMTAGNVSITITLDSTPISQGYVYIYDGNQWRKAIPYIYDGSQWRKAIPYIYNGSQWRKCGE